VAAGAQDGGPGGGPVRLPRLPPLVRLDLVGGRRAADRGGRAPGDTVETVSRTYVLWLRDDRDIPAQVLDRMLSPASSARHEASGEGT